MSATEEHVTLTDEERKALAFADRIALPGYVERILAAREQALREEERAAWSAWLDAWLGAVGPNAPTVEAVADALRGGPRPFGIARGGAR